MDSWDNVYITDQHKYDEGDPVNWSRIHKFDSNGNLITEWGSYGSGDGQFRDFGGIAADSSGNIYVSDRNNNRIQKFDSNGNFITKWGSAGSNDGQFNRPYGVAVDSLNKVYVADSYNGRIQKFDSNGNFITKWGSAGSGDGQFALPIGVAVDSSGDVYVVDSSHHRIQKFRLHCTDDDGDGYAIEGEGCGPIDCNDNNAAVNPGALDVINNGIDDDCNPSTPTASVSGNGSNINGRLWLSVNASSLGTSKLRYSYLFHSRNFISTSIIGISASSGIATITGTGSVNGVKGCTFTATVKGVSPDAFGIKIAPGGACTASYNAPSKPIIGGDYIVKGQ